MSGTKRTRLDRQQRAGLITPQTISLYRRALELRKRAHRSDADREAAYEAEAIVERALGGGIRRLWLVSVFDVYEYNRPGDAGWERAAELRRQLDAALTELKRQERAARRAKAAPPSPPAPAV